MKGGAQIAGLVNSLMSKTWTVGTERTCVRGFSEERSFSVSAVPPELPTSLAIRAVIGPPQKLRRASLTPL
jgi:hypothetical protein